jgi:hypothetical protein
VRVLTVLVALGQAPEDREDDDGWRRSR